MWIDTPWQHQKNRLHLLKVPRHCAKNPPWLLSLNPSNTSSSHVPVNLLPITSKFILQYLLCNDWLEWSISPWHWALSFVSRGRWRDITGGRRFPGSAAVLLLLAPAAPHFHLCMCGDIQWFLPRSEFPVLQQSRSPARSPATTSLWPPWCRHSSLPIRLPHFPVHLSTSPGLPVPWRIVFQRSTHQSHEY